MANKINSIDNLSKILMPYIEKAMKMTRDTIFEIVSNKVMDYYNEPVFSPPDETEPDYYRRTGKLMESLSASAITKNGNEFIFTVGFDNDYLQYRYPSGFVTRYYGKSYNNVTGRDVLNYFNNSSHGGTVDGEHDYWDEALEEINTKYGSITNLFKQNCKKVGMPIK